MKITLSEAEFFLLLDVLGRNKVPQIAERREGFIWWCRDEAPGIQSMEHLFATDLAIVPTLIAALTAIRISGKLS